MALALQRESLKGDEAHDSEEQETRAEDEAAAEAQRNQRSMRRR